MNMRLLLTSNGISNEKLKKFFAEKFSDLVGKKIALILTVRIPEDIRWIQKYHEEFNELGIEYVDLNISEEQNLFNISPFDGYYVCGGNTYYILDRLRKTGLIDLLKKEIKQGKPYIGVSAGSMIVTPDIEIAGWGVDGDENDIGLSDLSGMNITNMIIFPHYMSRNEQEVLNFEKKRKTKVVRLKDGEGIFIS